jgi:hypothetical protein
MKFLMALKLGMDHFSRCLSFYMMCAGSGQNTIALFMRGKLNKCTTWVQAGQVLPKYHRKRACMKAFNRRNPSTISLVDCA